MTTYTIALTTQYRDTMLLASCPDGDDIAAAVAREHAWERDEAEPAWRAVSGLTFTDDAPEDEDKIVWGPSPERGWLIDENGRTYAYAVAP
jgi:hypothetical protein